MSALGHKQTCAVQKDMSALHLKSGHSALQQNVHYRTSQLDRTWRQYI
jgi:hypothetical protein